MAMFIELVIVSSPKFHSCHPMRSRVSRRPAPGKRPNPSVIAVTESANERPRPPVGRTAGTGAQTNICLNNQTQEMTMSTRASLFCLAAIAGLATALASTAASAAQFTVNHPGSHLGTHFHPYPICAFGCGHDHDGREDERERDRREGWNHRPIYGAPAGVASVGASVAPTGAPAPAPFGGCLTKRELPDGSALFRDLCTQEQAESQPPSGAPVPR
jgi:hypothetical protein